MEGQPGHETRADSVQGDLPVRGVLRGEPAVVGITGASVHGIARLVGEAEPSDRGCRAGTGRSRPIRLAGEDAAVEKGISRRRLRRREMTSVERRLTPAGRLVVDHP